MRRPTHRATSPPRAPRDLSQVSDAQLLAESGHDPHAFRLLYDRHAPGIHGFFDRRCHDHETALELTAETFAQAWQARERFADQRDGSAGPWLYGIARNLLLRSVREARISTEARQRLGLTTGPGSTAAPNERWLDELDADLAAALGDLPDEQRRAVELRVLQDLDYRDVGQALDCSPGAARIRVSRGLGSLRASLAHRSPLTDRSPADRLPADRLPAQGEH